MMSFLDVKKPCKIIENFHYHVETAETKHHLKPLMNWTLNIPLSTELGFQVFQYPFSNVVKITE